MTLVGLGNILKILTLDPVSPPLRPFEIVRDAWNSILNPAMTLSTTESCADSSLPVGFDSEFGVDLLEFLTNKNMLVDGAQINFKADDLVQGLRME